MKYVGMQICTIILIMQTCHNGLSTIRVKLIRTGAGIPTRQATHK